MWPIATPRSPHHRRVRSPTPRPTTRCGSTRPSPAPAPGTSSRLRYRRSPRVPRCRRTARATTATCSSRSDVALYQKVDGVWTLCQRPYVKVANSWTAVNEAYVKRSGVWVQAYEYDVTPPSPPVISLSIFEDWDKSGTSNKLHSRWIKVTTRLPEASNDPDCKLIRILTTYNNKPPTTQFGGTYTSGSDRDWPNEPWSDWKYNAFGDHKDTSNETSKQWPRNVDSGYIIPGDQDYFFTGWSLDENGNWSAATETKIHVPKASVDAPNVIVKEATFQANSSGSWRNTGFQSGNLVQQQSPRSVGLWFFGNQFRDTIGSQGTPTIRNASIRIIRNDTGTNAMANLYLWWGGYANPGALPAAGSSLTKHEVTKLGDQIAKGEAQWFPLPAAFLGDLN